MKSFFRILLLVVSLPISALSFDVGLKVPVALGADITGSTAGFWPGFVTGGGFSAGCTFLEDARNRTAWSVNIFGMFTFDQYALPQDFFTSGAFLCEYNIRYGADLEFHFWNGFHVGAGALAIYTFGGSYGDASGLKNSLPSGALGHTLGATVTGGYNWEIVRDLLYLPVEVRASWLFSVPHASLWEFGMTLGLSYRIPYHTR
jgi:hypothetical protein